MWSKSGSGSSGTVTLVHAGHSETYYHASGSSTDSLNILRNRTMSMYVNSYASSAKFMTGADYATWYNKNISNTGLSLSDLGGATGLNGSVYQTSNTMLSLGGTGNGAYYWLATSYNYNHLYRFSGYPSSRCVNYDNNQAYGVRALVTLNSGVQKIGGDADDGWTLAI